MYQIILPKLKSWNAREDIACVVFRSKGDRAFCSGGDVKVLVQKLIENNDIKFAKDFFSYEYFVDYYIHTFSKPIIAWCDQLVMGGGLGFMNGASHRVVTSKTVMSMPEVSIGFFPDVGSTYYLSQIQKEFGAYLGMTGSRFSGAEGLRWGLADYCLPQKSFRYVMADILRALRTKENAKNKNVLSEVLKAHSIGANTSAGRRVVSPESDKNDDSLPQSVYLEYEDKWQKLWSSASSYEEFESEFLSQADHFIKEDIKRFKEAAPISKRLVWEIFKNRKPQDTKEALLMEWVLAINSCKNKFLREGVRAMLIDKDHLPNWGSFKDLSQEDVQNFFVLDSGEKNNLEEMIRQEMGE